MRRRRKECERRIGRGRERMSGDNLENDKHCMRWKTEVGTMMERTTHQ